MMATAQSLTGIFPGANDGNINMALTDFERIYYLHVSDVDSNPRTPSTIYIAAQASKYGEFTPDVAQIQQDTAVGGRGLEDFWLDQTRYEDAMMAFTALDGKIFPMPQRRLAEGFHDGDNHMPGAFKNGVGHNVRWLAMLSTSTYYAMQFTSDSSYTATIIQLWIRREGEPGGALNVAIHADDSGKPGAAVTDGSGTVAVADVDRHMSETVEVAITGASITATTFWVVVYPSSSSDNDGNHWEIGYDVQRSANAKKSTNSGSTWATTSEQIHFNVLPAKADEYTLDFFYDHHRAYYRVVNNLNAGTGAKLFINGWKGLVTSSASSTSTLADSAIQLTADQLISGNSTNETWIRIAAGTGIGQKVKCTTHSASSTNVVTFTHEAWDQDPDTTSVLVVYSVDTWIDISPSSGDQFDDAVTDFTVVDDEVWYARGTQSANQAILRMRWNSAANPPAHEFDDEPGGGKADVLYSYQDGSNGYKIWRGENDTMDTSHVTLPAWTTSASFAAAVKMGGENARINNIFDYNNQLWGAKEDGLYTYDETNDQWIREDTGWDFIFSELTGSAALKRNFFLYTNWTYTLQQIQKNSSLIDMANIGPDRGIGLPSDRSGPVSCLGYHPAGLLVGIDAGDSGYSSVLMRADPTGYHEFFRAPVAGQRIRAIGWQDCPGTFPRLWIDCGSDVYFQEYPRNAFAPIKDSGIHYEHETHVLMSVIDMGVANLPKIWTAFTANTKNLTTGIEIPIEYQLDGDIGDNAKWRTPGTMRQSPRSKLRIMEGEVYRIQYRWRLLTNSSQTPPIIVAMLAEGLARTPITYVHQMNIELVSQDFAPKYEGTEKDTIALETWLREVSSNGKRVLLESVDPALHGKEVLVEPPFFRTNYEEQSATVATVVKDAALVLRELDPNLTFDYAETL